MSEKWHFELEHLLRCVGGLPIKINGKQRFLLFMLMGMMKKENSVTATAKEVSFGHFSDKTSKKHLASLHDNGAIFINKIDNKRSVYSLNTQFLMKYYLPPQIEQAAN